MKRTAILLLILSILINGFSQTPGTRWTQYLKTYIDGEAVYDMKATPDGGYIGVGADSIFNFTPSMVAGKNAIEVPFIVKLDSAGNIQWRHSNSNTFGSLYSSVALSPDGGYVAVGGWRDPLVFSDSGQYLITKYNSTGAIAWEKKYGGSSADRARSITRINTGGYLVAGSSRSVDGDVTDNHGPAGTADAWLMKIDEDGIIIWKKCYGGTSPDAAYTVVESPDGGFVVGGISSSNNGDLTGNNGAIDAWLFKINSTGALIWQKNYGGVSDDVLQQLALNVDGSIAVAGHTVSPTLPSNGHKGGMDMWVARIANGGNIIWSKGFGGTQDDYGMGITATQDGSYLVSGYTSSTDMDISGQNGLLDAWLVKINGTGSLVWQKCIGTNKDEFATSVVYHNESEYTIAGLAVPSAPPNDILDAYVVRLGNASLIRGSFTSPFLINHGMVLAAKPGVQYSTIPNNDSFKLDVDTGTYTVTYTLPNPYYTVTPPSHNVPMPVYFDTVDIAFTVQAIPGQRDLSVSAVPLNPARPGFPVSYKIFYKNVGTDTVASGQVLFKRDSRMNFVSAVPPNSSVNGDTLKWNYSNLKPFDTASITVNMQVQAPPAVNIGDTLSSIALILPLAGDLTPSDDTAVVKQIVVGAYDPNDKTENVSGKISAQQVISGAYINYMIRFQNTGNDTAFNVVVRDTLDTKLEWNTIQMIGASHPYQLQINSQNRLAWHFNNIQLVDSVHNEPSSHGFIAYRIKPKNNLVVGDVIKNSASIYFDYNLPVRTNIQETIVINDVITGIGGGPQPDLFSLSLFPNPTGEIIWLKLKDRANGFAVLRVIDINGREVQRKDLGNINTSNYTTSLDLARYPPGMYTILLSVGKKLYSQKLVLQ